MKRVHHLALALVAATGIGCSERSDGGAAELAPRGPVKLHYYRISPT